MPATPEDMAVVHDVVLDATLLLVWASGSDAYFIYPSGNRSIIASRSLRDLYRAAVDQAHEEAFDLALTTLSGENRTFPPELVLNVLEIAGWTDALRDFKLAVLEHNGRSEVMDVVRGGRDTGGGIRRRVFRGFLGALNAALDSLSGLPGVGAIKELKDFLERALS